MSFLEERNGSLVTGKKSLGIIVAPSLLLDGSRSFR